MGKLPVNYTRIYKPGTWKKCNPTDPIGGVEFLEMFYKETGQYYTLLENHDIARSVFKLAVKSNAIGRDSCLRNAAAKTKLETFVDGHLESFLPLEFPGEQPIVWRLPEIMKHISGYRKNVFQVENGQKGGKKAADLQLVQECRKGDTTMTLHGVNSSQPVKHFQSLQSSHATGVGIPFASCIPFRTIWLRGVKHWEVMMGNFVDAEANSLVLPSLPDSAFFDRPVNSLLPGTVALIPASYVSFKAKECEQEVTSPYLNRWCSPHIHDHTENMDPEQTPARRKVNVEESEEESEQTGKKRGSTQSSGVTEIFSKKKKLKSISEVNTVQPLSSYSKDVVELTVAGRVVALGAIRDCDPNRLCHGRKVGNENAYVQVLQVLVPGTRLPIPTPEEDEIDNVSFVAWPKADIGDSGGERFRANFIAMFVTSSLTLDDLHANVGSFMAAENKKKKKTFTHSRGKTKDELIKMVAAWGEKRVFVREPLLSITDISWKE